MVDDVEVDDLYSLGMGNLVVDLVLSIELSELL